jgi:hypothetical protein
MHFNHECSCIHRIYEHLPQFLSSEPSGQSTMKSHHREFSTHCPPWKHFFLPSGHSTSSVERKFWQLLCQQQIKTLFDLKLRNILSFKTMWKILIINVVMKIKRTDLFPFRRFKLEAVQEQLLDLNQCQIQLP